jgi:hypothetical protein
MQWASDISDERWSAGWDVYSADCLSLCPFKIFTAQNCGRFAVLRCTDDVTATAVSKK